MTLKIRLYSDIHNEHRVLRTTGECEVFEIPEMPDDAETVLVLAGDVDNNINRLCDYLVAQSKRFRFVLHVPGNHEFYDYSMDVVESRLENLRISYSNIWSFLSEDTLPVFIDDVAFVGNTLWTDLCGGDGFVHRDVERGMNDFGYIKTYGPARSEVESLYNLANIYNQETKTWTEDPVYSDAYEELKAERNNTDNRWTTVKMVTMHEMSKNNLKTQIDVAQSALSRKIVMLTHHVPAMIMYENNAYEHGHGRLVYGYYCTDMFEILETVDYALHGHIHVADSYKYEMGEHVVNFHCNCVGYHRHEFTEYKNGYLEL